MSKSLKRRLSAFLTFVMMFTTIFSNVMNVFAEEVYSKVKWDFKDTASYSFNIQGKTEDIVVTGGSADVHTDVLKVDATCENGKFAMNGSGYAQYNKGTIISVPVAGKSKITVTAYSGQGKYDIEGDDEKNNGQLKADAYNYYYDGEEGYVNITSFGGAYLYSIEVSLLEAPKVTESDVKWDFKDTANYNFTIQNSEELLCVAGGSSDNFLHVLKVNASTGKFAMNGSGYAQFNATTVVSVPVAAGKSKITVVAYPGQGKYNIEGDENVSSPKPDTYEYVVETAAQDYIDITAVGGAYLYSIQATLLEPAKDTVTTPDAIEVIGNGKIDVWDIGAKQLDSSKYNNMLDVATINGLYKIDKMNVTNAATGAVEYVDYKDNDNATISDQPTIGSFTLGDFTWYINGKVNNRIRTQNNDIISYDKKKKLTMMNDDGTATEEILDGYLYSNTSSSNLAYVSLQLKKNDIMSAWVGSNSNASTIVFAEVGENHGDGKIIAEKHLPYVNGGQAQYVEFYAPADGEYKIYSKNEKITLGRLFRQHSDTIIVSGTIDETKSPALQGKTYTVIFTNQQTGEKVKGTVKQGQFFATIYEGYDYEMTLSEEDAYGNVINTETKINVPHGTRRASADGIYDVELGIEAVDLVTYSGTITGIDAADLAVASFQFTNDDKVYNPTKGMKVDGNTFTVDLERGTQYALTAIDANDYTLKTTTVTASEKVDDAVINFEKKPVYNVTVNLDGVAEAVKATATYTFSNVNESFTNGKAYTYAFKEGDTISLRDGIYEIAVSGLNTAALDQKATSAIKVAGGAVSKTVSFVPKHEWTFEAAELGAGISRNDAWYMGLQMYNVKSETKGHIILANPKDDVTTPSAVLIPANVGDIITAQYYYSASFTLGSVNVAECTTSKGSTGKFENVSLTVTEADLKDGYVALTANQLASGGSTYITNIKVATAANAIPYKETLTVGADKEYKTINEALAAVSNMVRTDDQAVTIMIDPGNYEEMLVVNANNVTLKNASATPSIETTNKGVDIDANAVRITSYYGHGYSYASMGTDNKWSAEALEVNKENLANGYDTVFTNPGSGSTNGSYWNATVVIFGQNFKADGIIFENSFNQYVSEKEANDIVIFQGGTPKGGERPTTKGDVTVQDKKFVERAAALAVMGDKAEFKNCNFISRQDTLYGHYGLFTYFTDCTIMGGTDYIFGGMTALFDACDLVLNISDDKDDVAYITAPQQQGDGARGYLLRSCTIKSTVPGVNTASTAVAKPCYFGRPWSGQNSETVFYNTTIEAGADGKSLITPVAWNDTLGGQGPSYEYGTIELSGEDNSASRASWSTVLTEPVINGVAITKEAFFGDWTPTYYAEPAVPEKPGTDTPGGDTPGGDTPGTDVPTTFTHLTGDVNHDGVIDSADASMIIDDVNKTAAFVKDADMKLIADGNGDGIVDSADASCAIEETLKGSSYTFPVGDTVQVSKDYSKK